MGVTDDAAQAVTMDAKTPGDHLYIVGTTYAELGGSHYFDNHGAVGNRVPKVDPHKAKRLMDALAGAMKQGLVKACHDCSEGGIAVAAAEMAFAGGLGMELYLERVPLGEVIERDDYILFSESNSRFIVEVAQDQRDAFETALDGTAFAELGMVTGETVFTVNARTGGTILEAAIAELKEAWQAPLRW